MHPGVREDGVDSASLSRERLVEIYDAREQARSQIRSRQPSADEIANRVADLGLTPYALELDDRGYTVIPPDAVATPEFVQRVNDAILRVATDRTGVPHTLDNPGNPGRYLTQSASGNTYLLWYLLFEDEIFEEWLENPALAAMVDHMLQGQGQLSSMMAILRWRNPDIDDRDTDDHLTLRLHADSPGSPTGALPSHFRALKDLVCNAALVLTPSTRDNGAIAIVPGSHRFGRQPTPGEGTGDAVAVEAEVGSLVAWRGSTWHGVFKRRTPGLRLNLTTFHCHRSLKTQERYQWSVPEEMLARRSARFARLVGADDAMGWGVEGPDYQRVLDNWARPAGAAGQSTVAD